MKLLKNVFSLIGLVFFSGFLVVLYQLEPAYHQFGSFDKRALETYSELASKILETGNAAEATVWKVKVEQGLSADDVEEAMKSAANEHNIKNVGELPLYKQVESMSGKPYRFMKIFMFCNALTAAKMGDYSDSYTAYLPCRVALVEDKEGQLWVYSLNMDLMIFGGKPLPPLLKDEAIKVKTIIQDIMHRGATGEF